MSQVPGVKLRPRSSTARRWPSVAVPAAHGRDRARHQGSRPRQARRDRRQHLGGHVRSFRRRGGSGDRQAARRETVGRRRRQPDAVGAARRRYADRRLPRIKSYKVAAVFEIGMYEFDTAFVFMPLAEAQAYFNQHRRRHRDCGLRHRSRPGRPLPPAGRRRRGAAGSRSSIGGSSTRPSSARSRSSATSCFSS